MKPLAIFVILLLVVGVIACGCTSKTQYTTGSDEPGPYVTTSAAAATPTKVTGRDAIQIQTHEIEYGRYGRIYVVGTAKNVGDERISWGSVDVKFYDYDGNLVGNGADMVQDLDPGETWKFKAMYFDDDAGTVDSYKIGVGSTW